MKHLLTAIENAIESGNYYAALTIALTIPDICGWINAPESSSKSRYVDWFNSHLKAEYILPANDYMPERVFLTGADFYALRCAYLHEGRSEISDQRAQEVLESFAFVVPPKNWSVHMNKFDNALQLQVDIFCRQIIAGAKAFLQSIDARSVSESRLKQLLRIQDVSGQPL